jgi:L-alanine-DL-glutamate epimerase-like enolase superfamily enzyme
MQVKRVICRRLQRDMGDRLWNAQQRWSTKNVVLVFVESSDGHIGVGESWTTGASPEALIATIEQDLAPRLVGKDPFLLRRFWEDTSRSTDLSSRRGITLAALSGVDTALWDLLGKATNTPLYKLLGGAREAVPCYASAGLYGRDKGLTELRDEMSGYVAQGFTGVKMKVGGVALAEDVERVRAVRDALGPGIRLMVDANYMLNVPDALRMARAFAPFDVHWLEAPVPPHDVAGQAVINQRSPIPVCGNETEFGLAGFRRLIDARAVEYVQPDVAVCGGISETCRIAGLAAASNLPVTMHASSTAVLFAASLHTAAAIPNLESVEYHMLHQWLFDRLPVHTFKPSGDGLVAPPSGPGIGIELHPDQVGESL